MTEDFLFFFCCLEIEMWRLQRKEVSRVFKGYFKFDFALS